MREDEPLAVGVRVAAPRRRLLVTRPEPQAAQWVRALRDRGVDADALPLIAIEPLADAAPLHAAWAALGRQDLVVFVSPNAVTSFFDAARAAWPLVVRAAAPGPGTAQALRDAGVAEIAQPAADAASFDSASLWERLRHEAWQGRRVLVVRGDGGRDELAARLRAAGAQVEYVQAYRRALPRLDAAQAGLIAQAQAQPDATLWHFSSSQAVDHLLQLAPGAHWSAGAALASHPRIAERARAAGFGRVHEVGATLDAVIATLQSRSP